MTIFNNFVLNDFRRYLIILYVYNTDTKQLHTCSISDVKIDNYYNFDGFPLLDGFPRIRI